MLGNARGVGGVFYVVGHADTMLFTCGARRSGAGCGRLINLITGRAAPSREFRPDSRIYHRREALWGLRSSLRYVLCYTDWPAWQSALRTVFLMSHNALHIRLRAILRQVYSLARTQWPASASCSVFLKNGGPKPTWHSGCCVLNVKRDVRSLAPCISLNSGSF